MRAYKSGRGKEGGKWKNDSRGLAHNKGLCHLAQGMCGSARAKVAGAILAQRRHRFQLIVGAQHMVRDAGHGALCDCWPAPRIKEE